MSNIPNMSTLALSPISIVVCQRGVISVPVDAVTLAASIVDESACESVSLGR